jgi:hypothetical protein
MKFLRAVGLNRDRVRNGIKSWTYPYQCGVGLKIIKVGKYNMYQ